MIILEDTRQTEGKHKVKHEWFKKNGIEIRRTKLYVGDYTLPTSQGICIDTKQHCRELYQDLISDHPRFHNECERAMECGIKLIILVENKDGIKSVEEIKEWKNPLFYKYWRDKKKGVERKPPASNVQLIKIMHKMNRDYGVEFMFCTPEQSAAKIIELLGGQNENA